MMWIYDNIVSHSDQLSGKSHYIKMPLPVQRIGTVYPSPNASPPQPSTELRDNIPISYPESCRRGMRLS